jgi:pilus assembly protein CpaC
MRTSNLLRQATGSAIAFMLLAGPVAAPSQAAGIVVATPPEQTAPVVSSKTETSPPLTLVVNKSTILRLELPATRISVGNPAVADITPINSREIIVLGKAIGTTNLIIWNKSGTTTMMDVNVTPEPVIAAPPPTPEQKDSVEVIKGLNRSKIEF